MIMLTLNYGTVIARSQVSDKLFVYFIWDDVFHLLNHFFYLFRLEEILQLRITRSNKTKDKLSPIVSSSEVVKIHDVTAASDPTSCSDRYQGNHGVIKVLRMVHFTIVVRHGGDPSS